MAATDAVAYFLEDQTYHGKAERTQEAYERVLRRFESFLDDPACGPAGESLTPADAGRRECMAWVHSLRGELAPSTVASYASYVHRFYAYMTQVGEFEANPMALVVEEMDESIDKDPTRRELSVPQMREFVAGIGHPLERALVVTLLKTGMRVGELCNLDVRDLSLDSPEVRQEYDLGDRVQLEGRPDSLFVAAEPARGTEYNGEVRVDSNKRKRSTVVPVDDELKRVLVAWLALRPDGPSPALFTGTGGDWGERVTAQSVRHVVRKHAKAWGWYRTGGGATENVTPHYFRHFFTTHLRDRTGDRGIVKYLRGDVASDIVDTYTHNWGGRVREVYEANVYSLL
ncbi:tyrosine-type recombinase/integrase [Haloarchaeobius sp. TZWWS8]|uniref:tyrosine-type recombinase/integrase n=1 Tax=Haloarchaeobius sp. TZWWS8 TaxID=3446121 RepID=UPI003EBA8B57